MNSKLLIAVLSICLTSPSWAQICQRPVTPIIQNALARSGPRIYPNAVEVINPGYEVIIPGRRQRQIALPGFPAALPPIVPGCQKQFLQAGNLPVYGANFPGQIIASAPQVAGVVGNRCGCSPAPVPLVNPLLPAQSPVSAIAPPTFLPPALPCQCKNNFLRKIPIPPPYL